MSQPDTNKQQRPTASETRATLQPRRKPAGAISEVPRLPILKALKPLPGQLELPFTN